MDEFDLKLNGVLSALAAIVNRAGRVEATSADAVKVVKVPVALLAQAMKALHWWKDTEYSSNEIRSACQRLLD